MNEPAVLALVAAAAALLAWFMLAETFGLKMRELPGALLAWCLGGESRRRLSRIIVNREEARRRPLRAAPAAAAELARLKRKYPVTGALPYGSFPLSSSADLARARELALSGAGTLTGQERPRPEPDGDWKHWALPEPTRLVPAGESACQDPDCTGCQALRARKRHEAAL